MDHVFLSSCRLIDRRVFDDYPTMIRGLADAMTAESVRDRIVGLLPDFVAWMKRYEAVAYVPHTGWLITCPDISVDDVGITFPIERQVTSDQYREAVRIH